MRFSRLINSPTYDKYHADLFNSNGDSVYDVSGVTSDLGWDYVNPTSYADDIYGELCWGKNPETNSTYLPDSKMPNNAIVQTESQDNMEAVVSVDIPGGEYSILYYLSNW